MKQKGVYFNEADPKQFTFWLGYFCTRMRRQGLFRNALLAESLEAGLKDLADELRRLVDWRKETCRGCLCIETQWCTG